MKVLKEIPVFVIMKKVCIILIFVYFQILRSHSIEYKISFEPPIVRGLNQWQTKDIAFNISLLHDLIDEDFDSEFELKIQTTRSAHFPRNVIEIVGNNVYHFNINKNDPIFSSNFQIKGLFLGYSNITIEVFSNKSLVQSLPNYSVSVIRKTSIFDTLFGVIIILLVTINYVNMGCHFDFEIVKKTLKTPVGPLIGFICQFTIMPIASYLIGWLMLDDISLRLGLFTLGCSPGGNSSNFWTLLFNGDVNLSITMTFISTIAALVMMPFWLFTLGETLFNSGKIKIPYFNLFSSLISLTFPMLIGIAIKHYKPKLAELSHKIIKPFTIIVVIFGIVGSSILYNHIFIMFTWPIVISGALVAVTGYGLGAIIATLFGMKRPQIIAISIETAYQNGGIAFILLLLSLQQPDADIASVPCIAQLLITGQPLWFVFIGVKVRNYCKNKNNKNNTFENNEQKVTDNQNNLDNACYNGPYYANEKVDNKINDKNVSLEYVTKF